MGSTRANLLLKKTLSVSSSFRVILSNFLLQSSLQEHFLVSEVKFLWSIIRMFVKLVPLLQMFWCTHPANSLISCLLIVLFFNVCPQRRYFAIICQPTSNRILPVNGITGYIVLFFFCLFLFFFKRCFNQSLSLTHIHQLCSLVNCVYPISAGWGNPGLH